MKVQVVGRNIDKIIPLVKDSGLEMTGSDPDIIIPYGGDGTLLGAEREFPGIPKFPLRDNHNSPLCSDHNYPEMLDELKRNELKKFELMKLSGKAKDRELFAMNDVFIHNARRVSAIRYRVSIDNELYAHEVVGDAAGVATVHGSTAYYRSITHSIFRVGIGLAFSNSTEVTNHLVLPETSVIRFTVLRGPAILVADNYPDSVELNESDEVVIAKSNRKATIFGLDHFMCQKCRLLRHPPPKPFSETE